MGGKLQTRLLDHIVALNERHLKRLLSEYVRYHHEDRTHLGLEKGTPDGRIRSVASGRVFSLERLGGLRVSPKQKQKRRSKGPFPGWRAFSQEK